MGLAIPDGTRPAGYFVACNRCRFQFMIRLPVRKNGSPVERRKHRQNPYAWVSVVESFRCTLFHRDSEPSRRGFSFDRATRGHNPALWNVWRQTRINAKHWPGMAACSQDWIRNGGVPDQRYIEGDKREPEVPPAYNG